jgi:hypothetical protein
VAGAIRQKGGTVGTAYKSFISAAIIALLARETNVYALQCYAENGKDPSKWKMVTEEEMLSFIGVLMVMDINQLPRLDLYWSTSDNPCYGNQGKFSFWILHYYLRNEINLLEYK